MSNLGEMIEAARLEKPVLGDKCNHCGWCCMTEVCPVGQHVLGCGPDKIPCGLLKKRSGGYFCSVARTPQQKKILGIGTGCCAITVEEKLAALGFELK